MLAPNNVTNTEWKWPEAHNSWLICFKYERIKKRCAMDLFLCQWMGWWWWHIFVKWKIGVITMQIMLLSSLDNAFCTAFTPYNSVIIALWWIHLYQMRSLNIHHLTLANAGREEQRTGHRQCERETQRQREKGRGRVFICLHFGVKHYTCDIVKVRSQVFDGEAKIFLTDYVRLTKITASVKLKGKIT